MSASAAFDLESMPERIQSEIQRACADAFDTIVKVLVLTRAVVIDDTGRTTRAAVHPGILKVRE